MIWGVDPGYEQSAIVGLGHDYTVQVHLTLTNAALLRALRVKACGTVAMTGFDTLVIERIESFGMAVGIEVFDTVYWSGRFAEAFDGPFARISRGDVKLHLCRARNAKDPNVRQALIDAYGPGKPRAIGTKATPGPLYGVVGHEWAALAVAYTYLDQLRGGQASQSSAV